MTSLPGHGRVIAALLAAALLTAALLAFGLLRYRESVEAQGWTLHTYEVLVALERLDATVDNDRGLAMCAMTGDSSIRTINASKRDFAGDFSQLQALVQDNPSQRRRLAQLRQSWQGLQANYRQPLQQWCRQATPEAHLPVDRVLAFSRYGATLRAPVHAQIDAMRRSEQVLLDQRLHSASTLQSATGWLLLAAVVIAGTYLLTSLVAAARAARALAAANTALEDAVSRRDQAVSALVNSEYAIRTIFDQIPEAIVILDGDGRIEATNATGEEFGWRPGQPASGTLHLPGAEKGQDTYIEPLIGADGTPSSYEFTRVRLPGSAGRRYLFVGRNVEERQKLERAKSEFLSTISHELRTPLTSLRAALSLLADEEHSEFTGDNAKMLRLAHLNSENLARLVNDIVDMERISSQQMEFTRQAVAIDACLGEVMEMAQSFAWVRDVAVQLEPVPAGLIVLADAQRLAQVVTNLLANAIKFTAPDTTVRLRAFPLGAMARIEVIDQGPGIPPEFEARVFQRFARADGTNTRTQGGSGLGLSIAKGMIERMGGQIGFRNLPEGGCLFWVELPRPAD